jgi:hypothetical protein
VLGHTIEFVVEAGKRLLLWVDVKRLLGLHDHAKPPSSSPTLSVLRAGQRRTMHVVPEMHLLQPSVSTNITQGYLDALFLFSPAPIASSSASASISASASSSSSSSSAVSAAVQARVPPTGRPIGSITALTGKESAVRKNLERRVTEIWASIRKQAGLKDEVVSACACNSV